jgi:hypothetical protein
VPAWAKPVLLTAGIGLAVFILPEVIPAMMRLWIEHLVETTLPKIDAILAERTPRGANIFERNVKDCLGIWKPLRFKIMEKLQRRGFVERWSHSSDGAVWLRRS